MTSLANNLEPATPFFSIIILCWESNPYISACLDSLDDQAEKDFEILLVDNGSPVPIQERDFKKYSSLRIKFLPLPKNIGFAGGNNYAARFATGKYLVLLNADAFPAPEWLSTVRAAIDRYPDCFFASKLIMANHPEKYDGRGDVYHVSGLVWRDAYNTLIQSAPETDKEVFSACGAAAIYPRTAFEQVEGFDSDYFSYLEDIDLGFRLRLVGYRCIYLPAALVRHVGSASTGYRSNFSVYHGHRNLVWTFLKDMPGALAWLLLPLHILANLFQVILYGFRKQGSITLRAKWDAIKALPAILEKRKHIQKSRTVSVFHMSKVLDWNPISPILKVLKK